MALNQMQAEAQALILLEYAEHLRQPHQSVARTCQAQAQALDLAMLQATLQLQQAADNYSFMLLIYM
jgi:hypothetical protein